MIRFRRCAVLVLGCVGLLLAACSSGASSHAITIRADGRETALKTEVRTVREALSEAGIALDVDDRVEPDLWVELASGIEIRVIRVQDETIVEREIIPYQQQTIRSEALAAGERRLLQAGKNGEAEVTYHLQFEDGVEVGRSILRREVIQEPVDQITVVGVEGMVNAVSLEGTIAYLSDGNAWLMRGTSGGRQPVTSSGELDGHVFALSPDGAFLLYTVATETVEFDGPFNDLYVLDVSLAGEKPARLPIGNVLWAGWSPDGRQIAYTTGEKSGPPGWKANNDLLVVRLRNDKGAIALGDPRRIQRAQSPGPYSWWGARYAWSPDGNKIAYARPDQLGYIDLASQRVFPLAPYAPLRTEGDWVWVPTPTWSPDSWFIAAPIHALEPGRDPEESQQFEVWAFDLGGQVRARLTSEPAGMWSAPAWSPAQEEGSQIAYAQAEMTADSHDSPYVLMVMDRDGSNKQRLFPPSDQPGITRPVRHTWSPPGRQLLVLYRGDLYLVDAISGRVQQLTGDGRCTHMDWAR